uniref:C-type lectin domain-containing protein n=1 Tax=Steinernema glaseri TaxID=37863 RepID=A0A1I7Y2A6_9BILA
MILLALLPLLLSLVFADQGCPSGASISLKGDRCYQPVAFLTDFHSAEKVCVEFGGHLASIHNRWDNGALIESDQIGNYWLGGQDINSDGSWTWTDGSAFNYNNWAASGGAMTGKNCLLLDSPSNLWQPSNCKQKANFICETPLPSIRTTIPTASNCPAEDFCMDGYNYVVFGKYLSWSDALSNCRNHGGHLASVHNARVEELLKQFQKELYLALWIGGQVDQTGNLNWSDGTSVNYVNWLPGHVPVPGTTEGCVWTKFQGTSFGWKTASCDHTQPSVCAIPL